MSFFTSNQKSILTLQTLMLSTVVISTSAIAAENKILDVNSKTSTNISQQQKNIEIAKLNKQLVAIQTQKQKEIEKITSLLAELESTATKSSHITDNLSKTMLKTDTVVSTSSQPISKVRVSSLKIRKNPQTINKPSAKTQPPIISNVTNNKKLTSTANISNLKNSLAYESKPKMDEMGELIWDKVIPASVSSTLRPISAKSTKISAKKIIPKAVISPSSIELDKKNIERIAKKPTDNKPTQIEGNHKKIAKKTTMTSSVGKVIKTPALPAKVIKYRSINTIEPTNSEANAAAAEIYLTALQAFSTNQTDLAINELKKYIAQYPNKSLIPKSHYWLGESYLQKTPANYSAAKSEFMEVINRYGSHPENDKQSKALYRLIQLSRVNDYKSDLIKYSELLQQKYPNSEEARLAKQLMR